MSRYDVAVVGLGAMGAAALYHVARRGRRVIGLERGTAGHEGGSSHGESRIIRLAQFENPAYTPLVERAWALWRDLGRAAGEDLILRTGMLEGGRPGTPIIEGSLRAARENGLPHEVLSTAEARARFPAFDLPADWTIVFQREAGLVRADRAMRLHVAGACAGGAEVREGAAVQAIELAGSAVRLALSDGTGIEAETVILAAGGWMRELVPELAPWLTVTRQAVCWFEPSRPADSGPERMPVFVFEDEAEALYGFPDFMGTGVKAASHRLGRVLPTAGAALQDAGDADAAPIAAALARLIPGAAGPVKRLKTCLYTSTPDEEFIVDRHPADPRIILCSACSGHGFKFASAFGEMLAAMTEADGIPEAFQVFGLRRFA